MPYYVYLLQCADDTYYTGMTNDLPRRLTEHETGINTNCYTASRLPIKLVWCEEFAIHDEAFRREHQIKGWSRRKKEALIKYDYQAIHEIVKAVRKTRF